MLDTHASGRVHAELLALHFCQAALNGIMCRVVVIAIRASASAADAPVHRKEGAHRLIHTVLQTCVAAQRDACVDATLTGPNFTAPGCVELDAHASDRAFAKGLAALDAVTALNLEILCLVVAGRGPATSSAVSAIHR